MNTCILNDMSQVAYISYERHVKYGLNVRYIHAYLPRICVLKSEIKWIREKCKIRDCSKYPFKMQNNDI